MTTAGGSADTRVSDPEDFSGVVEHLQRRGLLGEEQVSVAQLSGGVSNDVLAVRTPDREFVVKRALRRLRVAEEWLADPHRVLAEADALRAAAVSQPAHVPPVLDTDDEVFVIVIGHAEPGAREWKADLLSGRVDPDVPALLGGVLARWHSSTAGDARIAERFGDVTVFDQLRVDPFYRWVGMRHPDLAPTIDQIADRMLRTRSCLVHGDFSPKNVLLGPSSAWVIDWEVAHYGDPVFDLAFLLTHLVCKSLHRPDDAGEFRSAAGTFLERYRAASGELESGWDEQYLVAQTACLLLARIDGKSPAPYLGEPARDRGREIARTLLTARPDSLDDLWRTLL